MRKVLAVIALAGLLCVQSAVAEDPFAGSGPGGFDQPDRDDSTPAYLAALDLQRKGKWKEAQKAFREVLAKYPNSVHAHDCEFRGGNNCYLGCVKIHEGGPTARRIDVAVMGDGFQIEPKDQQLEEKWARLCLDVLWSEASFAEYKDYFNYYYIRLVSKDEGVDKVYSEAEKLALEEKNKKRAKKKKIDEFDTALNCIAAGPQGQVLADSDLVYQWLSYANREVPGVGSDGLVIAFARFGQLGMGGGGIANVGKPDKSVTVHEFGHSFVGLLDEYANNPGPPGHAVRAANATSDPKDVPWQHFLDKKIKGVDVIEGGATFQKGVWRPAPSCAMNAAGATGYCPVCREAAVLRIYNYCNPIDVVNRDPQQEMKVVSGDASEIVVTPMQPRTHDLKCEWYVLRVPDKEGGPKKVEGSVTSDRPLPTGDDFGGYTGGSRDWKRDAEAYEYAPMAPLSDLGRVDPRKGKEPTRFVFPTGKLPRGRYVVTCRVWDTTEVKGFDTPWVLKDPSHLLEERETWWVTVAPAPK